MSEQPRRSVTLLVPVFNEQEVLPILYARLQALTGKLSDYRFELLFVDDGSSDSSMEVLRALGVRDEAVSWVSLSRNFGKEAAMIAGLDHVRTDAVVILDADLQDPPELIPQMLEYWEAGYDDVFARRDSRAGETWFKKATSKAFYRLLERSTNIPIQRDTGDFRLLDRKCVDALRALRESERYTKGMFDWIGFRKKEILFARESRAAGTTKWNYGKLFDFAIDGLTSFTTAPLRWSAMLGFAVSAVAFVYLIVIVIMTLAGSHEVDGYPSLMAVILFLGGVQLIFLGILGEYIGRIFNETKRRPLYLVGESHRPHE
jgi:glycosyltransferase involved in cell wall biosynthesis